MSVGIAGAYESGDAPVFVFFCDTSDIAFGPVFYGVTREEMNDFKYDFLEDDPRTYSTEELTDKFYEFKRKKREETNG